MKDRKRLVVYSALALPIVVLGLFCLTLDPIARASFWDEFKMKTAQQFGMGEDEMPPPVAPPEENATSSDGGGQGGPGGGFSADEFFAERDTDGDGKLSGEEISDRMRENLSEIDTDQDGSVSLEEMQSRFQQMGRRRGGRNFDPAEMFSRQDADGDGKLTGDEIGERMRDHLEQIDTDQNGSVTLEELQNGLEHLRPRRGGGGGGGGGEGDARGDRPDRPQRPE